MRNNLHSPEAVEQRRIRIRLTLAAVAYEIFNDPLMPDADFDALALRVDINVPTGADEIDWFFIENFDPATGMWVYNHPELNKVKAYYKYHKRLQENPYDI
jgi:hypothetical protein